MLLEPINTAIHTLEADHPLLGQVLPVWWVLGHHFETWAAKQDGTLGKGVCLMFEARAAKHYQPVMPSSWTLSTSRRLQGTSPVHLWTC